MSILSSLNIYDHLYKHVFKPQLVSASSSPNGQSFISSHKNNFEIHLPSLQGYSVSKQSDMSCKLTNFYFYILSLFK